MNKLTTTLSVFGVLFAMQQSARAQEEGATAAQPVAQAADEQQTSSAFGTQVASDESVYVVQRRAYSKSGKFEVTPLFFTSLNNKFVGHFGPALALGYHMRENFAVELITAVPYATQAFYSALVYEVYHYESLTPEVVDLKQMTYWGGLDAQFSALYGKLEFYGWLIDYDFYVTAGFGLVETLETTVPSDEYPDEDDIGRGLKPPDEAQDRYKLAANLGGGMRLFVADWLGLRLEIRDVAYSDRAADAGMVTTDIRNNVLFLAGLTILL